MRSLLSQLFLAALLVPSSVALNILLTNEEGIQHPGLRILRDALVNKGHHVHTFAPKEDMSGMGAALTMPKITFSPHGDKDDENDMWAVDGTPSSAVLVGMSKMEKDPDLIISGINVGYASGPMDVHSSAVTSVLTGLGKDIPSFCILTNLAEDIDNDEHFDNAAVFVTHLVDVLVEQMVIFPIGVGLKIGYPALLPKDIPKVQLAVHGTYNPFSYGYYHKEGEDPDTLHLGPAPSAQRFIEDSDAVSVKEGNIAVLAITNDVSMHRREDNTNFLDDLNRVLTATDARFSRADERQRV